MRGKGNGEFEGECGTMLLLSAYGRAFSLGGWAGEADVVLDGPVVWERMPVEKLVHGEVGGPDQGTFPVLLLRLGFMVYLEDEAGGGLYVATVNEQANERRVLTDTDIA